MQYQLDIALAQVRVRRQADSAGRHRGCWGRRRACGKQATMHRTKSCCISSSPLHGGFCLEPVLINLSLRGRTQSCLHTVCENISVALTSQSLDSVSALGDANLMTCFLHCGHQTLPIQGSARLGTRWGCHPSILFDHKTLFYEISSFLPSRYHLATGPPPQLNIQSEIEWFCRQAQCVENRSDWIVKG